MSKLKAPTSTAIPTVPALVPPLPLQMPDEAVAVPALPPADPLLDTARVVLGALLSRQVTLPDPDNAAKNAMRYAVALHAERSNWGA